MYIPLSVKDGSTSEDRSTCLDFRRQHELLFSVSHWVFNPLNKTKQNKKNCKKWEEAKLLGSYEWTMANP